VQFLLVASESGNVALCELLNGDLLSEQKLPLSPHQTPSLQRRSGTWSYGGEGLRIEVDGQAFLLQADSKRGLWIGEEQGGEKSEAYAGAVVDIGPLSNERQWSGFKLADHGRRLFVVAEGNGHLREFDPFNPTWKPEGRWSFIADRLSIDVEDKWHLLAEERKPGILMGIEGSGDGELGFAVVRACAPRTA